MHWGEEMAGIRVWVDGQVVQEGGGDTRWYPGLAGEEGKGGELTGLTKGFGWAVLSWAQREKVGGLGFGWVVYI